jgi:hypothetical protein
LDGGFQIVPRTAVTDRRYSFFAKRTHFHRRLNE